MKTPLHTLKLGILPLLLFLILGTPSSQAQVVDSDFSAWTDGEPEGWIGSRTNFEAGTVQQIDENVVFGDYGVRLINEDSGHKRFTTQPLTVEAGQNYQVTYWVRGNGDVRAGLFDDRPDAFGFVYSSYNTLNSSDWAEYSHNLVAAEDTDIAEFILSVRNTTGNGVEVDRVTVTLEELSTVAIYDIQFTTEVDGASPLVDQTVTTSGVVSAVGNGGFFLQTSGGGAYNGIFVFTNSDVTIGDEVILSGNVVEYFGMTQLSGVAGLTVLSSGNAVNSDVISTQEVNSEAWEGCLIRVELAVCTNPNSGFGQFIVDDNSGACLVNPAIYEYSPTLNQTYNITGPVFYSFEEYKIMPRAADDVEIVSATEDVFASTALRVFPNPVVNSLQLRSEAGPIEGFVRIYNLQGQEVLQQNVGSMAAVIDVADLPAGCYLLHLEGEQPMSTRFIKR